MTLERLEKGLCHAALLVKYHGLEFVPVMEFLESELEREKTSSPLRRAERILARYSFEGS